jgi:hypothetical protein
MYLRACILTAGNHIKGCLDAKKIQNFTTVALSFVFGNECPIID